MNMTGIDLLTFARGTAFNWALGVLIFGLLLRMFEMLSAKKNALRQRVF